MGGNVIIVETTEQWKEHIQSGKVVIVDFFAVWCGPCVFIAPYFEELSEKYPGVVFLKVDVDQLVDVAAECGISAMPTFHSYKDGKKVSECVGASKPKIESLVTSAIA